MFESKELKQETLTAKLGIPTVYGGEDVKVGYRTLVDNACDPDCTYLEWRPDIKAFLYPEQQHGEDNV